LFIVRKNNLAVGDETLRFERRSGAVDFFRQFDGIFS